MYRVLLVEDEEIIRKGIRYSVPWEECGCSVVGEAENGAAGEEKIAELQPDIVITDITMPVKNGLDRIPSFEIIRRAKARGIKFTFGTNNVDADFGRLEYCAEAIKQCGLTADDIWFPSMSTRRSRPIVIYNRFE